MLSLQKMPKCHAMSVHEISKSAHLPFGKCARFPQSRRAKWSEAERECGNFEIFLNNTLYVNPYMHFDIHTRAVCSAFYVALSAAGAFLVNLPRNGDITNPMMIGR